jgi:shikimate 5-dehydrogenase
MKILLINLAETADAVEAMLSASFNFEEIACDLWQLHDVSASDVQRILSEADVDGFCVGGPLRRELTTVCGELEGDARVMGWIDSARPGGDGLIGDNTSVLALELGMSEEKMWPKVSSKVMVLGEGDWADSFSFGLSRVPGVQVVFAAEQVEVVDTSHMSWRDERFRATLSDADLVVNTTDLSLSDLPFTARELPQRCALACTGIGLKADEIVAEITGAHRYAMNGSEILLASTMLCFSRWTGIQPSPSSVAREALR